MEERSVGTSHVIKYRAMALRFDIVVVAITLVAFIISRILSVSCGTMVACDLLRAFWWLTMIAWCAHHTGKRVGF